MIRPSRPGTRFDLHLHSTRSDGRFPQEEVVERCARGGLEVIALTDHDIACGIDPGPHTFGSHTVHVIAGAEVSGTHEGREFHLLVYFPHDIPDGFRLFCREQVIKRASRYDVTRERLGLVDVPKSGRDARSGERALTRLHLAHAMVDAGRAHDVRDAFTRYLGHAHGKVPMVDLRFVEAIRMARAFGGTTSWAHPSALDAERYAAVFVAAGLQGLEVLRPHVGGTERRALRRVARSHSLFVTGGSDWHGWHESAGPGLFAVRGHEIKAFLHALDRAA